MIVGNLVGVGLGPMLIGLASDLLKQRWDARSLRVVVLAGEPLAVIPTLFYSLAMRIVGAAAAPGAGSALPVPVLSAARMT